ncbi:MAG: hypothetical protein N2B06_04885 [Clostridium sp.]
MTSNMKEKMAHAWRGKLCKAVDDLIDASHVFGLPKHVLMNINDFNLAWRTMKDKMIEEICNNCSSRHFKYQMILDRDAAFFQNTNDEFMNSLNMNEWLEVLDDGDQKIFWGHLKTIFYWARRLNKGQ